ncbi:hypothetical protein NL676_007546 [Syzygium grande]|nr:hypothetical protein NL676_007546 [Syzygium grande]
MATSVRSQVEVGRLHFPNPPDHEISRDGHGLKPRSSDPGEVRDIRRGPNRTGRRAQALLHPKGLKRKVKLPRSPTGRVGATGRGNAGLPLAGRRTPIVV